MSDNFGVFINEMVENLTKDFDYDYDTVEVSSKKIEVHIVSLGGFTQSFKMKFANRIEWIEDSEEFEKFGYDPKADVRQHAIDTIKVVWNEKKQN